MPNFIVKIGGEYLEWSTRVDAPVTFGMTRAEIAKYMRAKQPQDFPLVFEARMIRADLYGSSCLDEVSAETVIRGNRAGPTESPLTLDEIAEFYVRRRTDVEVGDLDAYRKIRSAPAGMRVLVCGGRDFEDRDFLFASLDAFHTETPISFLIEGGQKTWHPKKMSHHGADFFAYEWRKLRGVDGYTVFADWKRLGKPAGPIRNAKMVAMRPDAAIGFFGGVGTVGCLKLASDAGIRVVKFGW